MSTSHLGFGGDSRYFRNYILYVTVSICEYIHGDMQFGSLLPWYTKALYINHEHNLYIYNSVKLSEYIIFGGILV